MNKERSEKYNEAVMEQTYMLVMLALIKKELTETQYTKLKKIIKEECLKKKSLYYPLDYKEIITTKYLECV